MKKIVAGGFLSLIGTAWVIALGAYVQQNLLDSWYGSRFWASAAEAGMAIPLGISLAAVAAGLGLMLAGLMGKER